MSDRESRTPPAQTGASEVQPAHAALLEQYLHFLRDDPTVLEAANQSGREQTLQWATDELQHTAATLGGLSLEDARYELERVFQEVLERLQLPSRPSPAFSDAAS